MHKVKFAIFPEDIYKRLDKSEKEKFKDVVFTKVEIGEDGVVEITGLCVTDENNNEQSIPRRYL